jgi:hypothetical protein
MRTFSSKTPSIACWTCLACHCRRGCRVAIETGGRNGGAVARSREYITTDLAWTCSYLTRSTRPRSTRTDHLQPLHHRLRRRACRGGRGRGSRPLPPRTDPHR